MNKNENEETKLTKEGKILLLSILKAGKITPDQKKQLLEISEIETTTFILGDDEFIKRFTENLENEKN